MIHTRVPESLEAELRQKAQDLGISVSNLVRNVLGHAFGLVGDVVADGHAIARAARSAVAERGDEPRPPPTRWREADDLAQVDPLVPPEPRPARRRDAAADGSIDDRRGSSDDELDLRAAHARALRWREARDAADLRAAADAADLRAAADLRTAADLRAAADRRFGAADAPAPRDPDDDPWADDGTPRAADGAPRDDAAVLDELTAEAAAPREPIRARPIRRERPPTLDDVLGWQPIVLGKNAVCARCNAILPRGSDAASGVHETSASRLVICLACLEQLRS